MDTQLQELGLARQAARAEKNFALADQIRDQIAALGFDILDVPGGFEFKARSRFPVVNRITDVKTLTAKEYQISLALIVDGFADDAATSIRAIKKFTPIETAILVLISGEIELGTLIDEIDDNTFLVQVSAGSGWGEAANTLLKIAPSKYVVIMDPSTILTGDAITPTLEQLRSGEFTAVGWRGGLINTEDEWRSTQDRGPGEVDVLYSYFLAVNRDEALEAGAFNIRAIYYRNADIEFSLRLRQAKGRLLQVDLPLEQARHHGYYDTDPEFRDAQSKKNYDRILDRFRGKNEILSPRR